MNFPKPTRPEGWKTLARARGSDAQAIYRENESSLGAVYMAGIAVECALKGFYQSRTGQEPREIHLQKFFQEDISTSYRDVLPQGHGSETFFLEDWETAARYSQSLSGSWTVEELVDAARKIVSFLTSRI